jgi:hypothetical protein
MVSGDPDPVPGLLVEGSDRLVVVVVDLGQVAHRLPAHFGHCTKESSVARLGAQPRETTQQQRFIGAVTLA